MFTIRSFIWMVTKLLIMAKKINLKIEIQQMHKIYNTSLSGVSTPDDKFQSSYNILWYWKLSFFTFDIVYHKKQKAIFVYIPSRNVVLVHIWPISCWLYQKIPTIKWFLMVINSTMCVKLQLQPWWHPKPSKWMLYSHIQI